MRKADAGASQDQEAAYPDGRRLVAFRRSVERGVTNDQFQQQQQNRSADEAHQWRQQQCITDFSGLAPVDAGGSVTAAHQCIGYTNADDGTDQGVRAGSRQAEIPGPEIPEDRRDQQGEHHREAGTASDLKDQLDRQQ
jgi:hypothetical protein